MAVPQRVLLVDDDEEDALIVRGMLAESQLTQFAFEWISDFEAAVRALEQRRHDVYLIDHHLGEHVGTDLLRKAREMDSDTPVIMLTGQPRMDADNEATRLGASEYLVKGRFDAEMLERTLRYAINQGRAKMDLRFVSDAGRRLSRSLDVEETIRLGAQLAVPRLGDYCLIFLTDSYNGAQALVGAHADPAKQPLLAEVEATYRPDFTNEASVIARVMRTGVAERVGEVSDEVLARLARTPKQLETFRELRGCAGLAVPLTGRDSVSGAIVFNRTTPGHLYTADEEFLAQEFAHRVGMAADTASLYLRAVQATKGRDQLLAVVSHDLRNPVNTVGMSASFMLDTLEEGEAYSKIRTQLRVIKRAMERMRLLIDDLLDVARIEHGELSIDPAPVSVSSLALEVCEAFQNQFASGQHAFHCTVADDAGIVLADRGRILQALSNLLNNAVKFARPNEHIQLDVCREAGDVRFAVSNSGSRIADNELPNLFRPFWQGAKSGRSGAGLGLAITKAIVEGHGGHIAAENGSLGPTFHFTLPTPIDASASSPARPPRGAAGARITPLGLKTQAADGATD